MSEGTALGTSGGSLREFGRTPLRVRVFMLTVVVVAVLLPLLLRDLGPTLISKPQWFTAATLLLFAILNVELSRTISGGVTLTQQPHKALSAWAFACALLLPPPWLLVVVPLSYAYTRWRSLRVQLWKWVGSAAFLVLAGLVAAVVRELLRDDVGNWMAGNGGEGLLAMVSAAVGFLAAEVGLLAGVAWLNVAEDEQWLRRTLRGRSFYLTEVAVLLIAGLLSAVWTGGSWYALFFVPIYALVQRAALHEPLRERAETAVALSEKNEELERVNRFKVDLMGMLGHEIGNPLTSILGYSQVGAEALEEDDLATVRKSLHVVERNAAQIRGVVHDILSLVASETGSLTAHPEACELEPYLLAAARAQPPGRQPEVECPHGLIASVQSGHLDQVLANLLTNAEKYAGGATGLTARATGEGQVEIAVADRGPGVPPDFRDQMFERFSRQVDSARQVVGTGLGLFITRELVRANGGDVTHHDGEPSGSVFVVRLPDADALGTAT